MLAGEVIARCVGWGLIAIAVLMGAPPALVEISGAGIQGKDGLGYAVALIILLPGLTVGGCLLALAQGLRRKEEADWRRRRAGSK